jgi:hypothetical protein
MAISVRYIPPHMRVQALQVAPAPPPAPVALGVNIPNGFSAFRARKNESTHQIVWWTRRLNMQDIEISMLDERMYLCRGANAPSAEDINGFRIVMRASVFVPVVTDFMSNDMDGSVQCIAVKKRGNGYEITFWLNTHRESTAVNFKNHAIAEYGCWDGYIINDAEDLKSVVGDSEAVIQEYGDEKTWTYNLGYTY